MKRRNIYSWKALIFACILSCLVTEIDCLQDDTEKQPVLPSENYSALYEYEERGDLKTENDPNNDGPDNLISDTEVKENIVGVLAEITSKNAGVLNDLTTEGATVVVSLPETVTSELKAEAEKLSATVKSSQDKQDNKTREESEQATPEVITIEQKIEEVEELNNDTNVPVNETKDASEEIPSFSEWAQKRLEEAEKNFVNDSGNVGTNGKPSGSGMVKLGWKNYASPDCGAKVVAANPEAVSASSVISPSREEYKLNVCTNRIWFIVELCEAIQAKKIDIANFELFSSTPKEFTVSIGDRFPNREWTTVGQFTAKDERDVQSFDLNPHLFGRYIKVEIKSHHGSQHYCPISLFRVYGISELEVLQKEELSHGDDDDMEDNDEAMKIYSDGLTKNMLNSATNAVYSMIKKAAEVLGTKSNGTDNKKEGKVQFEYSPLINTCSTPSHNIICNNCTDLLFGQVYELLSCKSTYIERLADVPYIRNSLTNGNICGGFGLDLGRAFDRSVFNKSSHYVQSIFPNRILAAMCNNLYVSENKAVLNTSQQFPNATKTSDLDNVNIGVGISKIASGIEQSIDIDLPVNESENLPTDELKLDLSDKTVLPKVTCSTSLEYTSQIKPTKTVTLDVSIDSSNVLSETEELVNHVTKRDPPASEVNSNVDVKVIVSDLDEVQEVGEGNGQPLDVGSEPTEGMDHMENFMVDISSENGPSTAPPVSSGGSPADRQKESVFLRLSNRIKALERNVSLSSQYLEELSRRYKKQVEEMQKLEKTIQQMLEERRKINEKSKQLEERLDDLVTTLEKWPSLLFWFLTTITIFCGLFWICGGERQKNKIESVEVETTKRRKSVDIITNKEKKKVRRPSDQALKIVRSSLIAEEKRQSLEKRRRKRSNKSLRRSASIHELDVNGFRVNGRDRSQDSTQGGDLSVPNKPGDWVEENRRLIEVIDLDESENSSLEQFGTILEQDVPQYAKTAVDSRARRISSQHNMKPNINGDQDFSYSVPRKNDISGNAPKVVGVVVGRRASLNDKVEDGGNRKKEKRSFRSVLKNVFT